MTAHVIINYAELKTLKEYAENHILRMIDILKIYSGKTDVVGDRLEHCVFFDVGCKFVYSIEELPSTDLKKFYTVKKLSGSVNGEYPSVQLMRIIMKELNMKDFSECSIKINENDPIPNIEVMDIIKETFIV
ncbi:divergent P-loop NTPase [Moumouvirus australiensis]|uniref:Divergent P-loop NTPase n=1 Tax=Moumouvirus australiensis TaxID=2109587 RepID=A0A2P1EKQ7_9VIRU|nr:divergent P-loop NTPase [Moumouvirus australiensis]AVL94464.1 divergent P-loop NTPase [Moumouvirus australiensis]